MSRYGEYEEETETLQEALKKSRQMIEEQQQLIDRLTAPPFMVGTISQVHKSTRTVLMHVKGDVVEVALPEKMALEVGDTVRVSQQGAIVARLAPIPTTGQIVKVKREIDDKYVEIELGGSLVSVQRGKVLAKEGDRVILDTHTPFIRANLGKEQAAQFIFEKPTGVCFSDIGGLEEAKQVLMEAIGGATKYAKLYKEYGKQPTKGVLLYGPPGCGKTMLAKAVATEIAKIHGHETTKGFIYVKGPEILERWVGAAEETIRGLFTQAREHKKAHGYPATLFIDEADAILSRRGTGMSSDMEKTIVPSFLAELDGLEDSGAMVLLSTNLATALDPAVVREGRIDRKVRISRPGLDATRDIFYLSYKGKPFNGGETAKTMAEYSAKQIFDESYRLYEIILKDTSRKDFLLSHVINGALVVAVVQQAITYALQRDVKTPHSKCSGIRKDDVEASILSIYKQHLDMDHTQDVAEFYQPFKESIASFQKVNG